MPILPKKVIFFLGLFVLVEWFQRNKKHGLEISSYKIPRLIKWSFYLIILIAISYYGGGQQDFIYFQF